MINSNGALQEEQREEKKSKDDVAGPSAGPQRNKRYTADNVAEHVKTMMWVDKTRKKFKSRMRKARILHEVSLLETLDGIYSMRYAPGNGDIMIGFGIGAIQIHSGTDGRLKNTVRRAMQENVAVTSIRFHPKEKNIFYASSAGGSVFQCYSKESEFHTFTEEPNNEINSLDLKAEGDILVTGGKDSGIRLYDTVTRQMVCEYLKPNITLDEETLLYYHTMRVYSVRFHPQNTTLLVSGGWDDTCKIWDVRVPGGCIRTIYGPHICGEAIDLQDDIVLTGSWVSEDSLQLWDIKSAKLIETIHPANRSASLDGEYLYTAQFFHGDGYCDLVLVGGSGIKAVEAVSLKMKSVVGRFPAQKPVHTLDSHNSHVCFGGMDTLLTLGEFI